MAFAHFLGEDDEGAGVYAVATRLHMGPKVKLLLPVWQVAGHWTSLWEKSRMVFMFPAKLGFINVCLKTDLLTEYFSDLDLAEGLISHCCLLLIEGIKSPPG